MNRPPLACTRCGREIELCAFCESESCENCLCFRCLIHVLGQAFSYVSGRRGPPKDPRVRALS